MRRGALDAVTGATGFLGAHLARLLKRRGREVRVLVRDPRQLPALREAGLEGVVGDVTVPASLDRLCAGAERLYHCAGLVTDWASRSAFDRVNAGGARNVFRAAGRHGVRRVVHVSSTDVYGYPDRPVTEDAPLRPRGMPYADSKICAEEEARSAAKTSGLELGIVRPATIFGPGSRTFGLDLVERLRAGRLPLLGRREVPAGLAYVENVAEAIVLVGDADLAQGHAFNVHDANGVSWRRFFCDLADAAGAAPPRVRVPRRPAYAAGWLAEQVARLIHHEGPIPLSRTAVELVSTRQDFCTDRIRQELGFRPRVAYEAGMHRVRDWLAKRDPRE